MKTMAKRRLSRRNRGGYTLLEMLIAVSLMSLVFLGGMDLVVSSSRTTVRTQAQLYATADAANSIQNFIGQVREAQIFRLPTSDAANTAEDGWITPTNTLASQFSTTLSGGTVNTAIELTVPPALTPGLNGYKTGVSDIQVQLSNGTAKHLTGPLALYASQTPGTVVILIYRGDPDGTPDPDPTNSTVTGAGTYLWQYAIPVTGVFDTTANPPYAICKSISTAPNAVQFVRPASEPYQAEVKIISGYYSPINGTQTSEEGNGTSTSQLTGKCVYMRDHITDAAPHTHTSQSSNNPFQHH